MSQEKIFFCQPDRVKLPATLDVFTYGATGYLSIHTDDHKTNVALAGNAAAVVIALRQAADELEQKLFHQANKEKTRRQQLHRTADNWDWLTPEMVIKYFEQSPILRPVADDVKAVLAKAWPQATSAAPTAPAAPSQLDADLETIRPHLEKIITNGKANKSEIARILKIKAGGASNWPRLVAIAETLEAATTSSSHPPREWHVSKPDGGEEAEAA